jgi:hypothetical protein
MTTSISSSGAVCHQLVGLSYSGALPHATPLIVVPTGLNCPTMHKVFHPTVRIGTDGRNKSVCALLGKLPLLQPPNERLAHIAANLFRFIQRCVLHIAARCGLSRPLTFRIHIGVHT